MMPDHARFDVRESALLFSGTRSDLVEKLRIADEKVELRHFGEAVDLRQSATLGCRSTQTNQQEQSRRMEFQDFICSHWYRGWEAGEMSQ
jgi:hypothetical protein